MVHRVLLSVTTENLTPEVASLVSNPRMGLRLSYTMEVPTGLPQNWLAGGTHEGLADTVYGKACFRHVV